MLSAQGPFRNTAQPRDLGPTMRRAPWKTLMARTNLNGVPSRLTSPEPEPFPQDWEALIGLRLRRVASVGQHL
jgi:hypothetical protein